MTVIITRVYFVDCALLVTHYFLIAFVVSALLAYPILKGLIALKSRQVIYDLAPEPHQKKQGTPTMGGIIILVGAFAALVITWSPDWPVVLWMLGFAFIGFADDFLIPRLSKDKRGLGWKQKIVGQIILALLAGAMFPHFQVMRSAVGIAITAFLVLFFCNAYNFADGLDGLAGSLGLLLCVGFIFLFAIVGDLSRVQPFAAMAGAFVPFLLLNSPPAKVFMGDVGSLPLGAMFGVGASILIMDTPIASMGGPDIPGSWSAVSLPAVIVLSLIMIIELVPVPMQVAYYKLTKKRIFPMTPIHHAFEVKGWPESKIVWMFILAQLVFVVLAVGLATNALAK